MRPLILLRAQNLLACIICRKVSYSSFHLSQLQGFLLFTSARSRSCWHSAPC